MAFILKADTEHTVQRAWDRYDAQREALFVFRRSIESQFQLGLTPTYAPFIGFTINEYREEIDSIFIELDHAAAFSMLTAAEAELWRAYKHHGRGKNSGVIPSELRKLYAVHGDKLWDVEKVLDAWRLNTSQPSKSKFSAFKAAMKYRHWLAHGRHWMLRAQRYTPLSVFQICSSMVDEMSV